MESVLDQLRTLTTEQDEVIGEMECRIGQMVEALQKAADAGLTSVTAEEVRVLKQQVDERQRQLDVEKAAAEALDEERQDRQRHVEAEEVEGHAGHQRHKARRQQGGANGR